MQEGVDSGGGRDAARHLALRCHGPNTTQKIWSIPGSRLAVQSAFHFSAVTIPA
jgi:hypothetical protein